MLGVAHVLISLRAQRPPGRRFAVVLLIVLALIISIALTHWPTRLVFQLQRQELEDLSGRVAAGNPAGLPMRIGPFWVFAARRGVDGAVYLWTEPARNGPGGLMKCSPDALKSQANLWSRVRIARDWYVVQED